MNNNITNETIRTSRVSITPSGYFGNSSDMIQEIENFLTEEEILYLNNFAKNNTLWDVTESHWNENGNIIYDHRVWENRVATQFTIEKTDTNVISMLQNIVGRLKLKIEEFYNVECNASGTSIVRWPVGTMQYPHADKELHEGPDAGTPNDFPWYDLGTVFYLNDEYEGGELYFPLQNIEFKPKRGAAYFFPGDKNFIHGVKPVISGCRYTAPFFWTITKLGKNND